MSINPSMGLREWLTLLVLSVLWGASFFFVEIVIVELPTLTVVWLRVVLAAIALWLFALAIGLRPRLSRTAWSAFFVMGLVNNVIPFSLIVWGQTHIASGLAAILNATTPLFTVVVAGIFLTDERITAPKLFGVAVGFLGTVAMIGPEALCGLGQGVLAQLAVLGAAFAYAVAGVYGRRFKAMALPPVITAAGQVTASSLLMTPLVFAIDRPLDLPMPGASAIAALVSLAVLSTALAYILYFRLLASAGATKVLLVTFLIPVSAILLGTLILGESLAPVHFAGMALIGIGLAAIDGRLWKRHTTSEAGT